MLQVATVIFTQLLSCSVAQLLSCPLGLGWALTTERIALRAPSCMMWRWACLAYASRGKGNLI